MIKKWIGSPEWLKRERQWLIDDIEFCREYIQTLQEIRDAKPPDQAAILQQQIDDQEAILIQTRRALKLLRENPREYVRQTTKELS